MALVKRFWCPRDGSFSLDERGYLADPEELTFFGTVSRNPTAVPTAGLFRERCLVLLGEPGSGKTTALDSCAPLLAADEKEVPVLRADLGLYGSEDRLVREVLDAPRVREWAAGDGRLCLILDSLDEGQATIPHLGALLGRSIADWPCDRLTLRVACRTADWPRSMQAALERAFGDMGVWELLPLRRADVANLSAEWCEPDAFLREVERANVVPLATRPLTLRMLLGVFAESRRLPQRALELYEDGLRLLCDEPTDGRREARLLGELSPTQRLAVARRLAALSVFCGRSAVWPGPLSQSTAEDLVLDECVGGSEPAAAGSVVVTAGALDESARTGLFSGRGAQRLGWAHATFPEFLAARWMSSHGLADEQVRSLLVASDGGLFPQLRGVASWLVALSPDRYRWLAVADPESFAGQVDIPDDGVKRAIVEGLFEAAELGRLRSDWATSYGRLRHPGLAAQVRPRLTSGSREVRALAFDLARDCALAELQADLVSIILDRSADWKDRSDAGHAVIALPDMSVSDLRPLVLDAQARDNDPLDEVKGVALLASWPHAISADEVFSVLTAPQRRDFLGAYGSFLSEFAESLTMEHLDPALVWLAQNADVADHRLAHIANAVIQLALDKLHDAHSRDVLARVALTRAEQYEGLFLGDFAPDHPDPLADPARRRALAIATLAHGPSDDVLFPLIDEGQHGVGLVREEDLSWLAERYKEHPDERDLLAKVISWRFRSDLREHCDFVLALPTDHPLYVDVVHQWVEPIDLTSPQAEALRTQWEALSSRRRKQTKSDGSTDSVGGRIVELLEAFEKGDVSAYWQAARLLTVPPGSRRYVSEFNPDVTSLPRWKALSPDTRERFIRASASYLRLGSCDPERWLGTTTWYFPVEAAYRALVLLLRSAPDELAVLPGQVWREWAPIVVTWTATVNGASWQDKEVLLGYAAPYAARDLSEAVVAVVAGAAERGEQAFVQREVDRLWSEELSERLIEMVEADMSEPPLSEVVEALARNDAERVRPLLTDWLSDQERQGDRPRAPLAARVLLAHDQGAWPVLHRVLIDDPEFGKEVFLGAGTLRLRTVPALCSADLADLYLWLVRHFPAAEDPDFDDVHWVGPREEIGEWRDAILATLRERGTADAVAAVRRIAVELPGERWLRRTEARAEEALRHAQWLPTRPEYLLRLAADRGTRLIATGDDLLDVVLAALDRTQARLQGEAPESHLLWDTRSRTPKSEDELSDYLMRRLRDEIGGRGVSVNREVQVRRSRPSGIGERTDVRVDATAAEPEYAGVPATLTVAVEVKRAWNSEVRTGIREQLVDRYMRDVGTHHGLYVVAWYGVDDWWAPDDPDRSRAARLDKHGLMEDLQQQARDLANEGFRIEVVLLDVSYLRPPAPGELHWPTPEREEGRIRTQ